MSRGDRWYIFKQVDVADPGSGFDIIGWSPTKEGATKRVEGIDPLGGRSDGPTPIAFKVFASDRPEARKAAAEVFGVKVVGYISPEDKRAGRMIVKAAVMRAIFCPYTEAVLDMRRAVVVVTPNHQTVMAATRWDEVKDRLYAQLTPEQAKLVDVYDGRELFKR